jgi:hypothetical protein
MSIARKRNMLASAFLACATFIGALGIAVAQSDAPQSRGRMTPPDKEQVIPPSAFGVVIVEGAREASLLQLRGLAGTGVALLRSADGSECLSVPLRFVAGDFGGDSIAATRAKSIRLTINDAGVAQALIAGKDIVSDHYRVGTTQQAQIVIREGLTSDHGFVLNPGTSMLDDFFGADVSQVECRAE